MKNKYLAILFILWMIPFSIWGENSVKYPVLRSLLIPGMGETAIGKPQRGRIFLLTESALWLSAIGSFSISKIEKERYIAFSAEHADVDINRKDRLFWIDIGNYNSRDELIEEHLRFRDYWAVERYRVKEGDESDEWYWQWDSNKNREKFEAMRISSDTWSLAGKFILGGIFLNHVVSAIDVMYLTRVEAVSSVSVLPKIQPESQTFSLALTVQF